MQATKDHPSQNKYVKQDAPLSLLGSPWHLLVIRDVLLGRNTRSKILGCSIEHIPGLQLEDSLVILVDLNIIEVNHGEMLDVDAEFHLTTLGMSLEPLIKEYARVASQYFGDSYYPDVWDE